MKILIDARLYGLENAGLGRYIINLIKNLSQIDDKTDYIVLLRKKYFVSLDLPQNWKKVLVDFRHYGLNEQLYLPRIIKKENPDLCHFPHFNIPIFYSGNFIVTIHDLLMHQQKGLDATTLPAPLYFIKRFGYKMVFDKAIKRSQKILVPSDAVREELVRHYNFSEPKTVITYEGVDNDIYSGYPPKIPRPYFVYAGNAYPHKNLERLIEAIMALNRILGRKVHLAISSARNNFTQRIETWICHHNADKFVTLLGFVPDSELGALYKNSVGFVFPSLSEGFGLPGLEALYAGTLLLASDIKVFKEIYKNHALYFNPLDFSSIEKTMELALDLNEMERKQKIDSGQEFARNYSWKKMAQETLKVYEESVQLPHEV